MTTTLLVDAGRTNLHQYPDGNASLTPSLQRPLTSTITPSPHSQHRASCSPDSQSLVPRTPATAQQTYEDHLADLGKRSQLHSRHIGYNAHFGGALTHAEMLAAQQHFGFSPQQQAQQLQQQLQQQHADNGAAWHDEQEQFLRDLLSTPLDGSPNSLSGGSYISQSPPYAQQSGSISGSVSGDEMARYSSVSPGSSSGLHSLHDMIHGTNGSGSNNGAPVGRGAMFPDADERARAVQIKHEHDISQHFGGVNGPDLSMMDPGALDFFVKSMTNQVAGPQLPMMSHHINGMPFEQQQQQHQHMAQQQTFVPNNQHFHFQQPNRMSASFPAMYDHLQHQNAAQQQFIDSRKRSAPMPSTNGGDPSPANSARSTVGTVKRPRKSSAEKAAPQKQSLQPEKVEPQQLAPKIAEPFAQSATASFLPRMEVGSNATALAAIERLKAKKRAAAEQAIQQQALNMEAASKGGKGGFVLQPNGSVTPAMKHEKKVAHNAIERRYRNNINARISALRNAVPALRELRPKRPTRKGKEAPPEDLVDGVPAATKLNKATILGKATEYIRYLKGRETRLVSEVAGLRELIRSLEGGEELLDLWQGEMERVVAEQEAIAKAAFALEDESFDMGDDEDDEDEEEDEEKPSRSPSQTSSSRYMMGLFMGFSVLGGGAEVLSSSEGATSSSAAEHAHHVLRASSGRVLGASHQLLKRGMQATNVTIGSMAHDPHHFDHVANHLLVVEVLRGAALVACLAFIFWPVIARFLPGFVETESKHGRRHLRPARKIRREDDLAIALERKKLLATLADAASSPFQTDRAMRKFVGAPQSAFGGAFGLIALASRQTALRIGLMARERSVYEDERAAIWCRLLELETSMGPLAQRSLLARLHTLLTVVSLPSIGFAASSPASSSPLLHPARVFGTIAVAMVRASSGNGVVTMLFAERYWNLARRCRLLASDEGVSDDSVTEATDRWLDPVLDMSLTDAIALCPAPVSVASAFMPHRDAAARATMVSPLLCIAASQHSRQLSNIWTTLLCQIVRTTCPAVNDDDEQGSAPTCADFVKHHADAKIELPLLSDTTDRDHMTGQITRLTLTAPRCPRLQIVSNVTFGTWALLLGNLPVARSVAIALLRSAQQQQQQQEVVVIPTSATAYVALVLGDEAGDRLASFASTSSSTGKGVALTEVDALAAASLSWLGFLRTLSVHMAAGERSNDDKHDVSAIAQQAVTIRRLLAAARAVRPVASEEMLAELAAAAVLANDHAKRRDEHRGSLDSTTSTSSSPSIAHAEEVIRSAAVSPASTPSRVAQQNLDESLDLLTDILAVLGRKAATGCAFTKETLLQDEDNVDSGVEWVA